MSVRINRTGEHEPAGSVDPLVYLRWINVATEQADDLLAVDEHMRAHGFGRSNDGAARDESP